VGGLHGRIRPATAAAAYVTVGLAPVPDGLFGVAVTPDGLSAVRGGSLIVVADSNRYGAPGASADLDVVGVADALAGRDTAVLGHVPRGRSRARDGGADEPRRGARDE
jgi:hypothetical protein